MDAISLPPLLPDSLDQELLIELFSVALEKRATDLHFEPDGRLMYRASGRLCVARDWRHLTDGEGVVAPLFSIANLKSELLGIKSRIQPAENRTKMYRVREVGVQVRLQMLSTEAGEKIVQLLTQRPQGLVLVTGPMGSGKTTLAASIAQCWANDGRHLVTIEDPVEYILRSKAGSVSHHNGNFRNEVELNATIEDTLRADMDGLFLGEIRSALALRTCLEFAGMREPVITTAHGGSIGAGLGRILTLAEQEMSEATAKRALAQSIHSVLYVNLAFTDRGAAVPVVMCLPATQEVRRIIAENSPENFERHVQVFMKDHPKAPGMINFEKAREAGRRSSADSASIEAALPPEVI